MYQSLYRYLKIWLHRLCGLLVLLMLLGAFLLSPAYMPVVAASSIYDDNYDLTQVTPLAKQYPQLKVMANQRQWHHLLHYRHHLLSIRQRYRSQNADPKFFIHPQGQLDPYLELLASVTAMQQTTSSDVSTLTQLNNHAQCRFPARYHWLKKQSPELFQQSVECPALQRWQQQLSAHSLTLIFPASHINSPSSMYGHTLLRLDTADLQANKLLSYSVNFAAHHDPNDGELVFSYKGLTGGYPGKISVEPYYIKTNQYQKMEYRDTWEFPLNFNQDEVQQFVRHIWELKDSFFDYYFFDENCSYRLLAILDASSERANFADSFKLKALPVDTIRALQQQGFINGTQHRPSAATDMEWAASQVAPLINDRARFLVDHTLAQGQQQTVDYQSAIADQLGQLNPYQQAQMLELGVAYARYLAIKKKRNHHRLRPLTLAMLSVRSQLPRETLISATPAPSHRDDQGHASQQIKTALVYFDQPQPGNRSGAAQSALDIALRPAFHAVTDPVKGFIAGSQIEMGHLRLRLSQNDEEGTGYRVRLQQVTLVDVLSLTPHTRYQSPISWGVKASFERQLRDQGLYGQLGFRFGRSWRLHGQQIFSLWHSQLLLDNQFEDGFKVQMGPDIGWLYQGTKLQALVQMSWRPVTLADWLDKGDGRSQRQGQVFVGYQLLGSSQIGLGYHYQSIADDPSRGPIDQQTHQWQLQFTHYF